MASDFYVLDAKKTKKGGVRFRGVFTAVADHLIGDDDDDDGGDGGGGGGGGGGGRVPPFKIEIPDRTLDIKWIYSDGTPGWAIAAAEGIGYDTVHIKDLPDNYPFAG